MKINGRKVTGDFLKENFGKLFFVKNHLQGLFEPPILCRLMLSPNCWFSNRLEYIFVSINSCYWGLNEIDWIKPYEK